MEEVKKGCTDTTFIILQLNSLGGHDHYCLCLVYFLVGMTSTSGLRGRLIRDLSHSTCIQVKKGCVFCVVFFLTMLKYVKSSLYKIFCSSARNLVERYINLIEIIKSSLCIAGTCQLYEIRM